MATPVNQPERGPHLVLVTANPITIGGMQKFTHYLADTLLSAHWRVTVALSGENIFQDLAADDHLPLRIEAVNWLDATMAGDRFYRWSIINERRRWFRRVGADVALFVQSSNSPFRASIVGARLAGLPVVVTQRTMPWIRDFVPSRRYLGGLISGLGLHNRKMVWKTRLAVLLANHIVYNSETVRQCYERDYRFPKRKGRVIVNAVKRRVESEANISAAGDHKAKSVIIGYVGRLSSEKRLDVLLRAVARLYADWPVRVLIYGDGPERTALSSLAAVLGIADRVQWMGETDDIWSAYAHMDIVCLCSPRESSSNMVLEAMAAGKAVVVSAVGGLPELIGFGRLGISVPPDNVEALADALVELIAGDERRRALGERAGREVTIAHDAEHVGRQWLELLGEVATRRRGWFSLGRPRAGGKADKGAPDSVDGIPAGQY